MFDNTIEMWLIAQAYDLDAQECITLTRETQCQIQADSIIQQIAKDNGGYALSDAFVRQYAVALLEYIEKLDAFNKSDLIGRIYGLCSTWRSTSEYQAYAKTMLDDFLSSFNADDKEKTLASFFPAARIYLISGITVADKAQAVRLLHENGYPFQREVKGLSKTYVDKVLASTETASAHISVDPATAVSDNLIPVNVPASMWAGKPFAEAFRCLHGKYANEIIAKILIEKMGCEKTQAGLLFYPDDGNYKENRTYQRKIDTLINEANRRYSLTFDELM